MAWKPISLQQLTDEMESALAEADDNVRQAWERIQVQPEKWECSPWGDDGGGFWVVGKGPDFVVWYNDIECGFNSSPYDTPGVIGEYFCNQDDFRIVLMQLPEAHVAERFAAAKPTPTLPANLSGPGQIGRRQTTYWEVHQANGVACRVHFSGKEEFRFVAPDFNSMALLDSHPLLVHYAEGWASIFISGVPKSTKAVVAALSKRVHDATEGWRHIDEYLQFGGPTQAVLDGGHGCLLEGPRSVVQLAIEVLGGFEVKSSVLRERKAIGPRQVLLLGDGFVVAAAFRFEAIP